MRELSIQTEYIRLQDALKLSGLSETGGRAKVAVQAGEVSVNGEVCAMRGKKLRPGDVVSYNGEELRIAEGPVCG